MRWFFGESTVLEGVVFVASFGFDTVWPDEVEDVAASLESADIEVLSARNAAVELDSFRETCGKLAEKRTVTGGSTGPRWLLVLVNKVDLYLDGIEQARNYYAPGSNTEFDRVAKGLIHQMSGSGSFRYDVLPVTFAPHDYHFTPGFSSPLEATTQLSPQAAEASFAVFVSLLGELCGS
jgi:hypothetical protein